MLRLTLLLFAGMSAALFTLGENRGQLRPGLALAKTEGRLDAVWAEATAAAKTAAAPVAETVPVVADVAPLPAPVPVAAPKPVVEALPVVASADPVIEVAPGRTMVRDVEEPVFTLSALGNELVPGEDGSPVEAAATSPEPEAEAPAGASGTIWYVNADSVNVRAGPSSEAEIVGKLGAGEATLMVAAVDGEWARIVIQGDGVEGFVALRFLSPEAP